MTALLPVGDRGCDDEMNGCGLEPGGLYKPRVGWGGGGGGVPRASQPGPTRGQRRA